MECEVPNTFPSCKTIVAQLEIANLEEFLKDKKQAIIEIMKEVKVEKNVDFIFINCVDILNGFTIIFAPDKESEVFVTNTFDYEFDNNNIVKINNVVQRKDLTRILRKKYNAYGV